MLESIVDKKRINGGIRDNMQALAAQFHNPELKDLLTKIAENGYAKASSLSVSGQSALTKCLLELVDSLDRGTKASDIDREKLARLYEATISKSSKNYLCTAVQTITEEVVASKHAHANLYWLTENMPKILGVSKRPHHLLREILADRLPLEFRILVNAESRDGEPTLIHIPTDTANPFIRKEIEEFACSSCYGKDCDRKGIKKLASTIGSTLGPHAPRSLEEYNGDALIMLLENEPATGTPLYRYQLTVVNFSLQVFRKQETPNLSLEDGLSIEFIERVGFASEWKSGFRAVLKDPSSPPPAFDKWILFPNGTETRSISARGNAGTAFDFSSLRIQAVPLMKAFIWSRDRSQCTLTKELPLAKRFFEDGGNFVSRIRDGKETLVVTRANVLRAYASLESQSQRRATERMLIQLAELGGEKGLVDFEPAAIQLILDRTRKLQGEEKDAIEERDLKLLIHSLELAAEESTLDAFAFYASCLIVLTPLRVGEILDLKISELIDERKGKSYSIWRLAKGKRGGKRKTRLTRTARTIIDAVIAITSQTRMEAPYSVADYLFLCKGAKGAYRVFSQQTLRGKMLRAAVSSGIGGRPNPSAMRRRYMTHIVEEGVKRKLSRLDLKPLTNHVDLVTENKYYIRPDIRTYLEAVNRITIGENPAKGIIQEVEPDFDTRLLVEGGCGYCRNESCQIEGIASCLMCSGFVTTPAHIPEFREAINIINKRIVQAKTDEVRQNRIAVKRLFLYYLGALMTFDAETGEDGCRR